MTLPSCGDTSAGRDDARLRFSDGMGLGSVIKTPQSDALDGNLFRGEPLDDHHRATTKWAWPGAIPRLSLPGAGMSFRLSSEESLALSQLLPSSPVGEEAEKANADKSLRQDMQEKPAKELVSADGHLPFLAAVGVILPAKCDLPILQAEQTMV